MSENQTQLTLDTILKEMRAGFESINQRLDRVEARVTSIETNIDSIKARVTAIEHQLEQMDIRADRLEDYINKSLSEMFHLRAGFKEFKSDFKQPS